MNEILSMKMNVPMNKIKLELYELVDMIENAFGKNHHFKFLHTHFNLS